MIRNVYLEMNWMVIGSLWLGEWILGWIRIKIERFGWLGEKRTH